MGEGTNLQRKVVSAPPAPICRGVRAYLLTSLFATSSNCAAEQGSRRYIGVDRSENQPMVMAKISVRVTVRVRVRIAHK